LPLSATRKDFDNTIDSIFKSLLKLSIAKDVMTGELTIEHIIQLIEHIIQLIEHIIQLIKTMS